MSVQYPLLAAQSKTERSGGVAGYILGVLAFIPLLGVGFGIGAIVVGASRKQRSVIILGIAGIAFTAIVYGTLFYFTSVKRGGVYDDLRRKMAITMLNGAVKEVEYYRQVHGHYPASLKELEPQTKGGLPTIFDPTAMQRHGNSLPYFFYELRSDGKSYYLRSVGDDGLPFTPDDILPEIPAAERTKLGLLIDAQGG